MRSVLISIQPKWCEKIASGEKTIELRKSHPSIECPFKCYIYCTKTKTIGDIILCKSEELTNLFGYNKIKGLNNGVANEEDIHLKGKVIGEFICDRVLPVRVFENGSIQDYIFHDLKKSCVPYDEIAEYIGYDKTGYGWCISDLIIYDTPKELPDFAVPCLGDEKRCDKCVYYYYESSEDGAYEECCCNNLKPITRPPQSWCYTELIGDKK